MGRGQDRLYFETRVQNLELVYLSISYFVQRLNIPCRLTYKPPQKGMFRMFNTNPKIAWSGVSFFQDEVFGGFGGGMRSNECLSSYQYSPLIVETKNNIII